jgi:hypothetical protein
MTARSGRRSHLPFAGRPGMAERTLTVGSMSKSHAMTGSRLGWVAGPAEVIADMIQLATHTTYGVAGFIQEAALFALDLGAGCRTGRGGPLPQAPRCADGPAGATAGAARGAARRRDVCDGGCARHGDDRRRVRRGASGPGPCRRHARRKLRRGGGRSCACRTDPARRGVRDRIDRLFAFAAERAQAA